MNAPTTAASLLDQTSIANRAMLFSLRRGGTHRRVRDRDAEAMVKQQLGDEGQIVSRELFTDKNSLVYKYQQLSGEMYAYHTKATLPYGDDGKRLLPNASYFDYTTKMQGFISQLDNLKVQIIANWDGMVLADIMARNSRLMGLGKAPVAKLDDYPTASHMEARLYVDWFPTPISTSGDFRFQLPQDMLDRVDRQITEMLEDAGRDLYVRMLKPVTAFVDKLNSYKGDKGQRWHDSFIDNLNALTTELPQLNVNSDPVVDQLLKQIDQIITPYKFAPDALKEDEQARAAVKARMEQLEATLKGYAF